MNIEKLKEAERDFFMDYPKGFESPEMLEVGKKHKVAKMTELAHDILSMESLKDTETSCENFIKLVSRSSMVSLFEKPKFRDTVRGMTPEEKKQLVDGVKDLIHGNEEVGFNKVLEILKKYKLGKWTLITVFRCYYYPDTDMLYKPTTVKNIIKKYELEGLVYKPTPSYEFFIKYRDAINNMKTHVEPSLSPNNPSFSGFLMMTM